MKSTPILRVYGAGMTLAVAAVLTPLERLRRLRGVAGECDLEERLGRHGAPARAAGVRIVIHAVSAGEMAAAGALIAAVGAADPEVRFVVTTGNLAGRAAAARLERRFPSIEMVAYLPWDRLAGVRRFLAGLRPDMVVLVEAEIWPNLLHVCSAMEIPVVVVNGRLGPRAVARYRLACGFFADVLRAVEWIGVPGDEDRAAFANIGAASGRVEVMGDLKVDAPIVKEEIPCGWARVLDQVAAPLLVAGSTHVGEHSLLLEAFRGLRVDHADLRLVLAPRRPKAFRDRDIGPGLRAMRWSDGPRASWDVLIVDTIGVLPALYRWAEVAFVGGSLVDRGGHSPFEAAAAGRAIVIGPFFVNVRQAVEGLRATGGIHVLEPSGDLGAALCAGVRGLLDDPDLRSASGEKARQYLDSCRGVADVYARRLLGRLNAAASNGRASTGIGRDRP